MGRVKEINIKNRTYNFFNDMINIRVFYSSRTKTLIFITFDTLQLLKSMIMKIFTV